MDNSIRKSFIGRLRLNCHHSATKLTSPKYKAAQYITVATISNISDKVMKMLLPQRRIAIKRELLPKVCPKQHLRTVVVHGLIFDICA